MKRFHVYYILDHDGNPLAVDDLLVWAKWYETHRRQRIVQQDLIGKTIVSTIFLGLDHNFSNTGPPLLWETLVFNGPLDHAGERYASLQAARYGHAAMCDRVRITQHLSQLPQNP